MEVWGWDCLSQSEMQLLTESLNLIRNFMFCSEMVNVMRALFGKHPCQPHYKLNNVVAIIDRNGLQQTGASNEIMESNSLGEKFSSFGWEVFEVNGHDISELLCAFNEDSGDKPKAIIANTIKGRGFFILGTK